MYTFSLMQLLFMLVFVALLFFGVGVWWYRYTLKRDPIRLERMAREAKGYGQEIAESTRAFLDRTKK